MGQFPRTLPNHLAICDFLSNASSNVENPIHSMKSFQELSALVLVNSDDNFTVQTDLTSALYPMESNSTASSTRPDAPAHRRWSAASGRIPDRIAASRSAGRFCCRCLRPHRRARVCADGRRPGGRAGIPGRAFRRDGVCGRARTRWHHPWIAPHPDPLRASFARLDPVKNGARRKTRPPGVLLPPRFR